MRIAYLILAHRYPHQLVRLIDRLDTADNTFLVHLDKKMNPSDYEDVINALSGRKNIFFIKRFICRWGDYGIAQATVQGIKEAFDRKINFDYLALLSGQDYPIKSNEFIADFYQKNEGASFVRHYAFPYAEWSNERNGWDRVELWYFNKQEQYAFPKIDNFPDRPRLNRLVNFLSRNFPIKRKFPLGLHPYGGAQFWSLYYDHAKRINDFIRKHPAYVSFYKYVFVPDEILIQTLVGHLLDKKEVYNDTLTFLEWYRPGATLVKDDMENMRSTFHLYARKFDTTIDGEVLDIIDKELLKKGT